MAVVALGDAFQRFVEKSPVSLMTVEVVERLVSALQPGRRSAYRGWKGSLLHRCADGIFNNDSPRQPRPITRCPLRDDGTAADRLRQHI
jgi:hypothetical protein